MATPSRRLDELPPVLTTQQVADLLGLNPVTVREMARDGRLPARRPPGSRKFLFLADDVAQLLDASLVTDANGQAQPVPATPSPTPALVDPCDIWGAAPGADGEADYRSRCLERWLALAAERGVVPEQALGASGDNEAHAAEVVIGGITYTVRHGPRQRVLVVGDDGADRWELIDSVWVEPQPAQTATAGEDVEHQRNGQERAGRD